MKDFKAKLIKPTKVRDGYSKGVVRYIDSEFKVESGDKLYSVNGYDFINSKILYSKPNNDEYIDWTSMSNGMINKSVEHLTKVSKYWSTIYPTMKVRGIIANGIFIVKKIV